MSRRKQTKPLRLNEDEELQPGRRPFLTHNYHESRMLFMHDDAMMVTTD